ncbi:hypothetical protein [Labrys sp. (in: a-proteobacteria)]|uniref:hypothetical protein n=1 Tax=Labrys sp. (in: a-proteobacteria) TaxID=1917972 RepID=UPI0039E2C228
MQTIATGQDFCPPGSEGFCSGQHGMSEAMAAWLTACDGTAAMAAEKGAIGALSRLAIMTIESMRERRCQQVTPE